MLKEVGGGEGGRRGGGEVRHTHFVYKRNARAGEGGWEEEEEAGLAGRERGGGRLD